jgi:hypothetical protein
MKDRSVGGRRLPDPQARSSHATGQMIYETSVMRESPALSISQVSVHGSHPSRWHSSRSRSNVPRSRHLLMHAGNSLGAPRRCYRPGRRCQIAKDTETDLRRNDCRLSQTGSSRSHYPRPSRELFNSEQLAELHRVLGLYEGEKVTAAMVLLAPETNRVFAAGLQHLATAARLGFDLPQAAHCWHVTRPAPAHGPLTWATVRARHRLPTSNVRAEDANLLALYLSSG